MKADTICCYCISKHMTRERSIAESLYAYINMVRLTVFEVVVFSREMSQLLKIHPPPALRTSLKGG